MHVANQIGDHQMETYFAAHAADNIGGMICEPEMVDPSLSSLIRRLFEQSHKEGFDKIDAEYIRSSRACAIRLPSNAFFEVSLRRS